MNVYIRVPSTILDFEIPTFLYLLQRSPEFPASNEKIPPLKKQLVQRKWKLISDVSNKFNKPDAKRKSIAVERYRVLLVILMTAVCLRAGGAISVSITRCGEWRVASGVRRVACGGWRGVSRVTCYSDTFMWKVQRIFPGSLLMFGYRSGRLLRLQINVVCFVTLKGRYVSTRCCLNIWKRSRRFFAKRDLFLTKNK